MSDAACARGSALTDTQAQLEASRCLMCEDPPCVAACPVRVPVKHFIRAIRFESPRRAINLIREQNVLAGVCGLACPVERLCEGACSSTELSTPIQIGRLQHYAAVAELARGRKLVPPQADGQKVAVIGAGPSGLAAAAELARRGHRPTVFEKSRRPGGICTYGVPAHRIPQDLVAGEIAYIQNLGVEFKTGQALPRDAALDALFADGYRAVYVAAGAQQAAVPPVPGSDLAGVLTWKQLLDGFSKFNLDEGPRPAVARRVIVVGGGSVAMDVASVARELGGEEIDVLCLESPREMPADRDELDEVWNVGARFHTRSMPLEITSAAGKVTGLKAARIRWKEPDRFVPANAERIAGTEYWLPADTVIFAIGARPDPELARALPGVNLDAAGRIIIDPDTGATSRPGVFAGGDVAAGGGATIVRSVAEGKRAGAAIDAYLRGGRS
jgi:glutamate synthase (NADPH) small chain